MSRKDANTLLLRDELAGSAFFRRGAVEPMDDPPHTATQPAAAPLGAAPVTPSSSEPSQAVVAPTVRPSTDHGLAPAKHAISGSVDQSTDQSTAWSAADAAGHMPSEPSSRQAVAPAIGPTELPSGDVVRRPKAFYITKRLDRRIDEAVRYMSQVKGINKVDRSTVLNALADREELFSEEALDELADRVIGQLTSRLTSQ